MTATAPDGSGLLVLGAAVELMPVRDLPSDLRSRVDGSETDFVLSDRTARANSQRVDATTANLLGQFTRPRRIAEAIVAHSRELDLEPRRVLEQAYPLIDALRRQGVLVDAAAAARRRLEPVLAAGDRLGALEVVRLVSDLADTEVYEAAGPAGERLALKHLRPEAPETTRSALRREARALTALAERGCDAVPRLWEARTGDAGPAWLAMQWCEGPRLFELIGARDLAPEARAAAAGALLAAYARLHGCGVLHGDVHPGNAILGPEGRVRLLDLGGAVVDGDAPPERVGTIPFYEPEVAAALLQGQPGPPPTALGEQYGVAALAYALVAQGPYLALSLETRRALRQLAEEPPRPFAGSDLEWPAVERVLRRALAKDPARRHPTMTAFAAAFERAVRTRPARQARPPAPAPVATPPLESRLERSVAGAIEAHGLRGALTATGFAAAPTASLYAGAGGVALALARLACLREDPALLAAADVWLGHALRERSPARAFRDGSIKHGGTPGRLALLHSAVGLALAEAVVRTAAGDALEARAAVAAFVRAAAGEGEADRRAAFAGYELDATNGAASVLMGCALMMESTGDDATLRALGAELAVRVAAELAAERGGLLGFAHGRTGALHALLRWAQVAGEPPDPAVIAELAELAAQGSQRGGGLAWPVQAGSEDPPWTGWCHGSAGHVLTWVVAAGVTRRDDFLELAAAAGRHVWSARGRSGPSLCCGAAGEGLALLVLAAATGEREWRDRGRELIAGAADHAPSIGHEQGLFRAPLGVALAAAEALAPAPASWPLAGPAL